MLWNKKEKSDAGLPDLPGMTSPPSMSDLNRLNLLNNNFDKKFNGFERSKEISEDEIHGLPSFPDSPMKKGFSQTAIKEAVQNEEINDDVPELPDFQTRPMEIPKRSRVVELDSWPKKEMIHEEIIPHTRINENKPVFVRIDKFHSARESLEIVKVKLEEIDELLRTIREVKMKEDQEITSWGKEIESIKARLNSIVSDVFESGYS